MSFFLTCSNIYWKCTTLSKTISRNLRHLGYPKLENSRLLRLVRQMSLEPDISKSHKNFVPFLEEINLRWGEARRSILVQVQSSNSFKELHAYCNTIGTVKGMYHYSTGVDPLHFIIIEFESESDVTNILATSSYLEENQGVPVSSQFLWFKASNRKLSKLKHLKNAKLSVENGIQEIGEQNIKELLKKCENISEQMRVLYSHTKLNDVGIRLRYLTAKQIEMTVTGMFPYARAYPFGSSVNGCGKMGCDLDLVLRLNERQKSEDSRLVFHCKASSGSERTTSQKQMEVVGDLIHLFLPGCTQVRRILHARVPIIKYYQQFANVECDLSMSNMSGVHMSEFIYIMGVLDDRVRPLIFTIRKWAKEIGLTNSSPGRWITNFSLTLLVLAFLQKPMTSPAILPSLNTLVKQAGSSDVYITEDGINCTFLRDINKLNHKTENTESLQTLLCEFFEYCSQFDFNSKAVCLNEGVALTKPEFSAMYIVNPLERGLNVSKNVSLEELERFKMHAKNAAWAMESQENQQSNWGLLSIFEKKKHLNLNITIPNKQERLMEISTLFGEEGEEDEESRPMEYKNVVVKNEVECIKKSTSKKIKDLIQDKKRRKSQR